MENQDLNKSNNQNKQENVDAVDLGLEEYL